MVLIVNDTGLVVIRGAANQATNRLEQMAEATRKYGREIETVSFTGDN